MRRPRPRTILLPLRKKDQRDKKREKKNLQSSSLAGDFFSPCGEKKRLPAWGEETWRRTGFYPLQSCMNHSCCPNAKAFKGDEITISYIDEDLPYDERQALLADYGFRCMCQRCLEEMPGM
ncbi:hypothetical protein GW17_00000311 [Ensete ventricosum]|nr:hypothetical protein GW17_00000311 [Ensete ventricosum]